MCWDLKNFNEDWAILLRSKVFRGRKVISHHIFSSIWSSVKSEMNNITDNCRWIIGNGENINFCLDTWLDKPVASILNFPDTFHTSLTATVSDYIQNSFWHISQSVSDSYPTLYNLVMQITLPKFPKEDKLIWESSSTGNLSLKEAFLFKYSVGQNISWAKDVWSPDIPPSKSLMTWRLMHNKLPTDDNMALRGCNLPSMCSSCHAFGETAFHLFFECSFAQKLWSWLASLLNKPLLFNSLADIWAILDNSWTPQCKVVVQACIVNLLNIIWYRRNNIQFQDKIVDWRTAINLIISKVSLSGNLTSKTAASNMLEFTILKACKVNIKPPRPSLTKEVIWAPPLSSWVKVNTDGASIPTRATAGGIFRNSEGVCLGGFSQFLGDANTLHAELIAVMNAIEVAALMGFSNVWLESDSQLVILAFKSNTVVPWGLRNRWENCIHITHRMRFCASHIYREGNICADSLANFGLSLSSLDLFWFDTVPDFVRREYNRNRLGMPNFRFVTF